MTSKEVGNGFEMKSGGWEFNHEVAADFDDHVRKHMPNYEQIQKQVVKMVGWFTATTRTDTIYDLGAATGETMARILEEYPDKNYVYGVDAEKSMLEKAKQRLNDHPQAFYHEADVTDYDYEDAQVVISLFTMSFLSEPARRELIRDIYQDLNEGGALIFVEKTRAESGHLQPIFDEHYWDFKAEQGVTPEEIINKAESLRGQLRPLTVNEYQELLESAGFDLRKCEIFYKWNPWAGFVARK